MKIAVNPTVFIALGGTGQLVVQRVRELVAERVGTADLPFFRYLYVDTDVTSLGQALTGLSGRASEWSSTNRIEPSPETIRNILNRDADQGRTVRTLQIDQWFERRALDRLGGLNYSQGAGGRRMFSRLGFLASTNLPALENQLQQYYDSLRSTEELVGRELANLEPAYLRITPVQREERVRFVVVGSSGGGTASGCLIDLGYFLRRMRQQRGWSAARQLAVIALARPVEDATVTSNQISNTAGLLTELDHYLDHDSSRYHASYLTLGAWSDESHDPPYDATYVAMAQQQDRMLAQERPFDACLWKVAEYLALDAVSAYSDEVENDKVKLYRSGPVGVEAFQGDLGLNPKGLQAFGISWREWPALSIHKELFASLIEELASKWTEATPAEGLESELRRLLGIPSAADQANHAPREVESDAVAQGLLGAVDGFEPRQVLTSCSQHAFEGPKFVASRVGTVCDRVTAAFQKVEGRPQRDLGTVFSILRANQEALVDSSNPESISGRMLQRAISSALNPGTGPRAAILALESLVSAAELERAWIAQCSESLKTRVPDAPLGFEAVWKYANDLLLDELLRRKAAILEHCEERARRMVARLKNLQDYLSRWKDRLANYKLQGARAPSSIVPQSVIDRLRTAAKKNVELDLTTLQEGLSRELIKLAQDDFPETDAQGSPTLFARGLPMRSGRLDFSWMDEVERTLFSTLERSPASPYREGILALLIEQAAARGEKPPDLLKEAEFLVHFDTGAESYRRLNFGGNPTHLVRIFNIDQEGSAEFDGGLQNFAGTWLTNWTGVGAIKTIDLYSQVTSGVGRHVAGVVVDRCSILSKHIVGYELERRREIFEKLDFPCLSDRRVRLPVDPKVLAQARQNFLGSMVMGLWTFTGGENPRHFIEVADQDPDGNPIKRRVEVPTVLRAAVGELAENAQLTRLLEFAIGQHLSQDNLGKAANHLTRAVKQLSADPGQEVRDWMELNLRQVPYDDALNALYGFARRFKIPLEKAAHPYASFVEKGGRIPADSQTSGQDGWFCSKCGYSFGLEMPPRSGAQACCPKRDCCHPLAPREEVRS